ncbi:MAG: hypothetical protein JSS49_29250 [Planctomycetes bacterium]|nr:hypothetical protein [Planctomycetota bacterium]
MHVHGSYRCLQKAVWLLFVMLGCQLGWAATGANAGELSPPRTVAVVPLMNLSNDSRLASIADAIGDLLTVELSRAVGLELVERTEIERVIREQSLTDFTKSDPPLKLGKLIGAQFVFSGSVMEVDGQLQIVGHLVEVATTRVAKSFKVQTRPALLDRGVAQLSHEVVRGLDFKLPELTDAQIDQSPEANLHFMRGLGLHFAKSPDEAIICFLKALAIDPRHARARFWCGIAYSEAGEAAHARIELTRFVKQFPDHPLAARAHEWLADANSK